jgi:predicted aspartyl protease
VPVVEVNLLALSLECLLDTGFAGGIVIPFPTFESLGLLARVSSVEYHVVLPDSRTLPLFTARRSVRLGSVEVDADIHSSPSLNRTLAGRNLLENFVSTLDGQKKTVSISG